jgi:hypothetical protein
MNMPLLERSLQRGCPCCRLRVDQQGPIFDKCDCACGHVCKSNQQQPDGQTVHGAGCWLAERLSGRVQAASASAPAAAHNTAATVHTSSKEKLPPHFLDTNSETNP